MGVLKINVLEDKLKKKEAKLKIHSKNGRKVSACSCPCSEFRHKGVITMDVAESAHWNID